MVHIRFDLGIDHVYSQTEVLEDVHCPSLSVET